MKTGRKVLLLLLLFSVTNEFMFFILQKKSTLLDSTPMVDGVTCMAFTISFVPNTGNKYFMAACDEHLRLYDFEQAMVRQKKKEKEKEKRLPIYYI